MLKWQILRDKSYYCSPSFEERPIIWKIESSDPSTISRADPREIWKLKVGWNLAYRNYSLFRKGARHLHWKGITWNPRFTSVDVQRTLLTFWRGAVHGRARATHRQCAIDVLTSMCHSDILIGGGVRRQRYLRDIQRSKAVVSPFGYGEPCYRDMEAFIHGAVLVKPSMEFLETFPNVYREYETYIPVKWDFSDLEEVLTDIDHNFNQYRSIAKAGQNLYRDLIEDPGHFVAHWKEISEVLFCAKRSSENENTSADGMNNGAS